MDDFAIIFSTTETYLSQALFMYEQLCTYGLEKYAWVVPLENIQSKHFDSLYQYFGNQITDVLRIPETVKLSGNKIFLPKMVPKRNRYVIIDTDILILERGFIDTFLNAPEDQVILVKETFLWQEFLLFEEPSKRNIISDFRHLFYQPYVQTGSIGISHKVYENIFNSFVTELTSERIYKGDLTIWNDWVSRFPELFQLVNPHSCLVLRPDGCGPSSKLHIPYLTYKNDILFYRNFPVMALHFTESNGIYRKWHDYKLLISNLKSW